MLIHEGISREIIGAAMEVLNFKGPKLEWKRVVRSKDNSLDQIRSLP